MKWTAPKKPQVGDVRCRRHFAWWPVTIGEKRVWLEIYYVEERLGNQGWWYSVNVLVKPGRGK